MVLAITTNHQYYPELQKGTHRVCPHIPLPGLLSCVGWFQWVEQMVTGRPLWYRNCEVCSLLQISLPNDGYSQFPFWWSQRKVPVQVCFYTGFLWKQGSHFTLCVTELVLDPFSLCVPGVAEEMSCQNNKSSHTICKFSQKQQPKFHQHHFFLLFFLSEKQQRKILWLNKENVENLGFFHL